MTSVGTARALCGAIAGGALTAALLQVVPRLPDRLRTPWARHNHAGEEVTLLEGPAVVAGLTLEALTSGRPREGSLVVLVPGLLGAADDLLGDTGTKGLRGHLGALASGRVTTGAAKVAGLGAAALLTAVQQPVAPRDLPRPLAVLRDSVVVAGAANLVNLLDLRPGRALKVTGVAAALLLGARPTGPTLSRSLTLVAVVGAALPPDLAGRSMLGDCGANPLGASVGLLVLRRLGPRGRAVAAALLVGLTLLSERVSFTQVIERTPVLHRLDMWGRRAPTTTVAADDGA